MKDKKYSLDYDNPEVVSFVVHFRDKMEYKNGCRINEAGKTAIVYNAELAAFLHSDKFPIGAAGVVDGKNYRGSYIAGFIDGQEYFKKTHGLPSGAQYLKYDPKYKADLYSLYNNIGHDGYEGWNFVQHGHPITVSHEIIKDWGYYGGIIFEYEELLTRHPSLKLSDEELNYVLKKESIIFKLFEDYGSEFPDESKELWQKRWINGDDDLPPIKIDEFKTGNNKHLLLTILHEAHPYLKIDNFDDYVKRRWGLKAYHSDISKYLSHRPPHPDTRKINALFKI